MRSISALDACLSPGCWPQRSTMRRKASFPMTEIIAVYWANDQTGLAFLFLNANKLYLRNGRGYRSRVTSLP